MKRRVITSVFLVLALALAFVSRIWTPYVFDLMILALAVMGAVEVARVLERQLKYTNFVVVATIPAVLYLLIILVIRFQLIWQYLLVMLLGAIIFYFLLIFLFTLLAKKSSLAEMEKYGLKDVKLVRYALDKAMYSLSVLVYPTLLFMAIIIINHLNQFDFVVALEMDFSLIIWFVLVSIFAVTMLTDTMAYLIGSTVRGPKLCPLISPNKTISGAIGGFVGGIIAGLATYALFTINNDFFKQFSAIGGVWWVVILISALGSVISQFGDILASALKRRSRVKDYGTIFPGHGGVMDRVDGLVFNAALNLFAYIIMISII